MGNQLGQGCATSVNKWKRRSGTSKIIGIIFIILILLCFTLAILWVITHNKLQNAREDTTTCRSALCVEEAAQLLEKLNPEVKPCDNFYEFACGNFIKTTSIPDNEDMVTITQNMQNDVFLELKKLVDAPISLDDNEVVINTKYLYASCMNNTTEEEYAVILPRLLERAGGWPIIDPLWDEQDLDVERSLAILFVHGVEPFIKGTVEDDDQNKTDYLLDISSGSLILKDMYYLNKSNPDYVRYFRSYKKMIVDVARILGGNESVIQEDVEEMMEFEIDYASISESDTRYWKKRHESNIADRPEHQRYTISKLEKMIPEFKWSHFLDKIFQYFELSDQKDEIIVRLRNKKYFRNLAILLTNTPPRALANYLTWRFVYKLMPYLDKHFRRLYYDFRSEVPGLSLERVKLTGWKECVRLVKKGLEMPLTAMYVKDNFDDTREKEINELINSIKKGVIEGVKQQDWLDANTKALTELKVQKVKNTIAFPRFLLNGEELEKEYKGLHLKKNNFLDNLLTVSRHRVATKLSKLTGKIRRQDTNHWREKPLQINAFYDSDKNKMVFPLAILRSPVFIPGRPKFVSYSTLGSIIGHEITHGLDTSGFAFDSDGVHRQWWPMEAALKLKELAQCFVEQYSKLTIEHTDKHVDGENTVNDDICDNSGLRNAYRAYDTYVSDNGEEPRLPGVPFTNSQVFFLKNAQLLCEVFNKEGSEVYAESIYSPGRHRVNVPMSNSPEFSAAFNCPLGSPMNPRKKCSLWS